MRISALAALLAATLACSAMTPNGGGNTPGALGMPTPSLVTPAGFVVTTYANVPHARFMTLGPDGSVYVSASEAGRIVRLVDRNGVADSVVEVVRGLDLPHGMTFHKGALYVATHGAVVRLTLGPDGRATGSPVAVNHYTGGDGHWSRTIVFGADSAMYVAIGSSCNLCVEKDSDRAVVMRYNEDGSNGRVFARGLRNAVGLAVAPTGAIWATQNERDDLPPDHEDLPPDELNILRAGGDYGWPYCYGDRVPSPEYHDAARCAPTIAPALGFQAHSAALGIAFLTNATTFPSDYRGDALVAFHGSWDRSIPTGAKVVRVHVVGGVPVSYDDFVTGWQRHDGSRWGRPVDVLVARDGSVLISDDLSGAIYRVSRPTA
jgi:glucose/arabinose dehydrogenase